MKRIISFAAGLGVGLFLLLVPSQIFATCSGISQPLTFGAGGFVQDCVDSGPVSAYAYVSDDASINSSQIEIACNQSGVVLAPQDLACQLSSGIPGDGQVTIQMNWSNLGPIVGCPNQNGQPGVGRNSIVVTDNTGRSAILEVGYNPVIGSYLIETINNGADTDPMSGRPFCNDSATPVFLRDTDLGGGDREVCVSPQVPTIFSDCDAGANGAPGGSGQDTCVAPGDTEAVWEVGNVWWKTGRCNRSQNPNIADGGWNGPITPTAGEACIPYASPLPAVCVAGDPALDGSSCGADADCDGTAGGGVCENMCIFAASDAIIANIPGPPGSCFQGIVCTAGPNAGLPCPGGDADCGASVAGDNVIGWTPVAGGPLAASDRAVARLAELGKNVLKVEFSVSLEQNARSFDILAGGRVINDSPILAESRGTYLASINKAGGKLKGAKEITVRTNLDGGGTLLSDPLSIKHGKK